MNRYLLKEINKMKTHMGLIIEQEEELTPEDLTGLRVMVYYNLHKHTFSVTYGGRVILYADYVKLRNVEWWRTSLVSNIRTIFKRLPKLIQSSIQI